MRGTAPMRYWSVRGSSPPTTPREPWSNLSRRDRTPRSRGRIGECAMSVEQQPPKHDADEGGRFGPYGCRCLPEALAGAVDELAAEHDKARSARELPRDPGRLPTG